MKAGTELAHVGAVVIGRNEAAHLRQCLNSLSAIRERIVYSDSASTDASCEIARDCGAHLVRVDPARGLSPARGRNVGFDELMRRFPDCDFVQFLDGDSWLADDWLVDAIEFLRAHPDVAVVCGHLQESRPQSSIYNWMCDDEWTGAVGQIQSCGGNALIRTEAFRQVGGFLAELAAGEEAEMMSRMRDYGWRVWRLDTPMASHDADLVRFKDWWSRAKRGGFAAANICWITRKREEHLYCAQLRSSIIWALCIPAVVLLLSVAARSYFLIMLLPACWVAQLLRIALKRRKSERRWMYAGLILLAKLPEALGAIEYTFKRVQLGLRNMIRRAA